MNPKQIEQIMHFLSAYPKDVVEFGIEAWRTGEMPTVMVGSVSDVPLAQKCNERTDEAGIQRIQNAGFRIKCGMTEKRRRF